MLSGSSLLLVILQFTHSPLCHCSLAQSTLFSLLLLARPAAIQLVCSISTRLLPSAWFHSCSCSFLRCLLPKHPSSICLSLAADRSRVSIISSLRLSFLLLLLLIYSVYVFLLWLILFYFFPTQHCPCCVALAWFLLPLSLLLCCLLSCCWCSLHHLLLVFVVLFYFLLSHFSQGFILLVSWSKHVSCSTLPNSYQLFDLDSPMQHLIIVIESSNSLSNAWRFCFFFNVCFTFFA